MRLTAGLAATERPGDFKPLVSANSTTPADNNLRGFEGGHKGVFIPGVTYHERINDKSEQRIVEKV